MPQIAISYRRTDSAAVADRIRDKLVARYGKNSVFVDIYNVPIGVDFRAHIEKTWSEADVLLVLIGRNWLRTPERILLGVALRYILLSTVALFVAHYLLVNTFDLDLVYLRTAAFIIPALFGAALFGETRSTPVAVLAVSGILGLVAVSAMTISASLRYHQPIMPINMVELLDNLEFMVIVAAGFFGGNLLARLPYFSFLFEQRDDWVRVEVETALEKSLPVIPILLDGASMPGPRELPKTMRKLSYLTATELRSGLDFDAHMSRLMDGIDQLIADRADEQRG